MQIPFFIAQMGNVSNEINAIDFEALSGEGGISQES